MAEARYQIFKAQQNKQCRKLGAERLTNLQHGDGFLKMFVLYVNSGTITQHAVSLAAMSMSVKAHQDPSSLR